MGGKSSTISTSEQRILSLQVQQSSQGLTLPVVYGRARVAGNLVWYGDFTTYEHKTTTRQGGKGGGGVKQEDVKYTYEAAVMMALCEGEIKGVTRIWRDKEKFSSPASLRLTLYKGGEEQPVWPHLQQVKHAAQAISYSGTAYLCSPNYELTKSAQIYSHNFEVDGKLGYSTSIVDANPRDIIRDLLTNQKYGCGFPVENLGDTDVYGTYCRAAGIFLSPVYSEQQEAQRNIAELLEQTNSAAVFSQGRLKIVPYGDSGLSGNGATYIPNLTPLYDLSDDDFIVSGAEDPVRVERKTNADAYNQVQIEYTLNANRLTAGSVTAREMAAGSITADKLNVNNLSAISADMGDISGGSLNIGGGQFTVSSDGSLVAQNAVVRGRIEGESGYFNGTIKASRIEGDVMKVVRMKKLSNTVWEASIQAEALPMMVRPDFEVRTVNPDHARRNQATAEFLVDGKRQPVSRSFETRVTSVIKNEKYNTIDVKTDYTATTSYGWYVLPRNKSVLLRLQLAENETPTTPIPCLQTAYLSPSDAEYKTLIGKMVWRRLTDYVRLKVGWLENGMWKAVYGLPDDIYGLRLKYLTDNNPEWANGIVWMQDGTATAIKANSTANHAAAPRQYTREVNQASSSNAVILSARNSWQWMELRDVEVLVLEDRVF